jgi:hypothetical protein
MITPEFQAQSQPQLPSTTANVSKKPKRISGRTQSYLVQGFVFDRLMALKAEIEEKGELSQRARDDANAIASTVKAWETAQERVRIHRGRPLPGTYRPKEKMKVYRQAVPLEPRPCTE